MKEVSLGKIKAGPQHRPYLIAEMSGNHNQSLERALTIVDAAAKSGADALKIQTYKPETMTLDLKENEFFISDPKSPWQGRSLFDLYGEAMTPWEWHAPIQKRCHELGLEFFSTPFDETAVEFLEELNVPFYKIASFENIDTPLIKRVAKTGKPVIMSTGLANLEELEHSVKTLKENGAKDIVLLKCTSAYPAPPENANLKTIVDLRERFECLSGLSDHTLGTSVAVAAVALGATVIEKHFTLARAEGGVDSAFSLEPDEFKVLRETADSTWKALGQVFYGPTESEKGSLNFRRSLYFVSNLEEGKTITAADVRAIRPGRGLSPRHLDEVIGKVLAKPVSVGTPVDWNYFKN